MFGIDPDRLLAFFTADDRDLALALVLVEGFSVISEDRHQAKPLPVDYHGRWSWAKPHMAGAFPFQIRPGVFAYRIRRTAPPDGTVATLRAIVETPGRTTTFYAERMGVKLPIVVGALRRLVSAGALTSRIEQKKKVWLPRAAASAEEIAT